MRRDLHHHRRPPKRAAPGAQDAQRAEEISHRHFARSQDSTPDAALWAIDEAMQAGKRAGRALLCGNVLASLAALNEAMRAMSAAGDSLQGLLR